MELRKLFEAIERNEITNPRIAAEIAVNSVAEFVDSMADQLSHTARRSESAAKSNFFLCAHDIRRELRKVTHLPASDIPQGAPFDP